MTRTPREVSVADAQAPVICTVPGTTALWGADTGHRAVLRGILRQAPHSRSKASPSHRRAKSPATATPARFLREPVHPSPKVMVDHFSRAISPTSKTTSLFHRGGRPLGACPLRSVPRLRRSFTSPVKTRSTCGDRSLDAKAAPVHRIKASRAVPVWGLFPAQVDATTEAPERPEAKDLKTR